MTDVDPSIPYHEHWRLCVEAFKEVSRFAEDYGVTLALQNHPPIIESYEDVLDMVEEVGSEALKTCIDPELLIWVRDVDPYTEDVLEKFKTIYGRVGKLPWSITRPRTSYTSKNCWGIRTSKTP